MEATVATSDWLARYRRDGFARLTGLFGPAETAAWDGEARRLAADARLTDAYNLRSGRSWRPGTPMAERLDPVVDVSPVFASLARDPRLLGPVERALAEEPALLRDKLILKPSGMGGYDLHQDAGWWQDFPYQRILTAAVAIDPATATNGAIEFVAGFHHRLLSAPGELRDMTPQEARDAAIIDGEVVPLTPGDVVLFHALTPHRSAPNRSGASRRLLYFTFGASRDGDGYQRFYAWYRALSLAQAPAAGRGSYFFA